MLGNAEIGMKVINLTLGRTILLFQAVTQERRKGRERKLGLLIRASPVKFLCLPLSSWLDNNSVNITFLKGWVPLICLGRF